MYEMPDHYDITYIMRNGEPYRHGSEPRHVKCTACKTVIYGGDTSYGGLCEDCFEHYLRMNLTDVARKLGFSVEVARDELIGGI